MSGGKRIRPTFAWWGWRGAGGLPGRGRSRCGAAGDRRTRADPGVRTDPRRPDGRQRNPPRAARPCTSISPPGTAPTGLARAAGPVRGSRRDPARRPGPGLGRRHAARLRPARRRAAPGRRAVGGHAHRGARRPVPGRAAPGHREPVDARRPADRPVQDRRLHRGAPAAPRRRDRRRRTGAGRRLPPVRRRRRASPSSCATTCSASSATRRSTGKPAGDDLREGKRTLLLACATERAEAGRPTAPRWPCSSGRSANPSWTPAELDRVRELLHELGAVRAVEQRITALTGSGLDALAGAPIAEPAGRPAGRAGRGRDPPGALTPMADQNRPRPDRPRDRRRGRVRRPDHGAAPARRRPAGDRARTRRAPRRSGRPARPAHRPRHLRRGHRPHRADHARAARRGVRRGRRAARPTGSTWSSSTPGYRAHFADGSTIDVHADAAAMEAEVRRACGPAAAAGYRRLRALADRAVPGRDRHVHRRQLRLPARPARPRPAAAGPRSAASAGSAPGWPGSCPTSGCSGSSPSRPSTPASPRTGRWPRTA